MTGSASPRPTNLLLTTVSCFILCVTGFVYIHRLDASTPIIIPDHFAVVQRHNDSKQTRTKFDNEIINTRHARYVLYGEGRANKLTTKRLHNYIRSLTSKQAPGGIRLASKPGRKHFSQIGASQFVDRLLKGRRQGVFVECGAADGESLSNSLFFELHRNWTGVLIEGNPRYYPALLSKNRNAYVVRACLSTITKPQTVKFKLATYYGGIDNKLQTSHIRRFGLASKPSVDVQCFSFTSITAALGIQHIDYFSLDVEGPELEILRTIDWTQLSIDVITVEYNMNKDKLNRLRSVMKANGTFTEVGLLGSGQDVVFMHRPTTAK